jgi:hypothetical protein
MRKWDNIREIQWIFRFHENVREILGVREIFVKIFCKNLKFRESFLENEKSIKCYNDTACMVYVV